MTRKSADPAPVFDELCALIVDRTLYHDSFDAVSERLAAFNTTQLLETFQEWDPKQDTSLKGEQKRYPIQQIMAVIGTRALEDGVPLPEHLTRQVHLLPLATRHIPTDKLLALFDTVGDTRLVETIEFIFKHDYFSQHLTPALALRIEGDEAFERMIRRIATELLAKNFAPEVEGHTDRVLPIIRTMRTEKDYESLQTLHLLLANQRCAEEDDDLYLEMLGHKLKGMRQQAQYGVSERGERGRAVLERGVSAKKKAVREWCETQLAIINEASQGASAGEDEVDSFAQLDEAKKEALGARIDELYQQKPAAWKAWISKEVSPDPMLWLHATIALFEKNTGFIHRWEVFKTLLTHSETSAHHEAMWRVYLHHLARNPNLSDSYVQWHIKKHFDLIPSSFEQEALEHALYGAEGSMTVPMFEHYFAVNLCSPKMLPIAIEHKSKKVRDAAIKAAVHWPEGEDAAPIVALLEARKKGTRQCAAEALLKMPVASVAPHKEALKTYLEAEKDATTQGALDATIARLS